MSWPTPVINILLLFLAVSPSLWSQKKRSYIPPPLRVHVPFEAAWTGMESTLQEQALEVLREDRERGFILTKFQEYISGPLTESYMEKIGERPKLIDGDWIRVHYQYEILIEFIQKQDVRVTVHANIEALKRSFFGSESWVTIQTNGSLEERLLTNFGRTLFGQSFALEEPKKGFWQREPGYVPNMEEKIPPIVGPERKR